MSEEIRAKDIVPHKTSFDPGDGFYGDGNTSFFMEVVNMLKLTAQNSLAGNVAPAFDPTRTSENPYIAGESVVHDGELRTFIAEHYGAWNKSKTVPGVGNLSVCPLEFFAGSSRPVADLNDALDNVAYLIRKNENTNVDNLPDIPSSSGSIIFTIKSTHGNYYDRWQIIKNLGSGDLWHRLYQSQFDSWSDWAYTPNAPSLPATIVQVASKQIFNDWNQNISDLNDVTDNSVTIVQRTAGTATLNFPSDYGTEPSLALLCVYKGNYNYSDYQIVQVLTKIDKSETWFRNYNSYTNEWSFWERSRGSNDIFVSSKQIFAGWNQNISDLNDVTDNSVTIIQRTENTATQHLPSEYTSGVAILSSYKAYWSPSAYQIMQYLVNVETGETWLRTFNSYTNTWSAWTYQPSTRIALRVNKNQIFASWNQNIADLNDVDENSVTLIQRTAGTTTLNFPSDYGDNADVGLLCSYKGNFNASGYQIFQVLTKLNRGGAWFRFFNSNTNSWSAWEKPGSSTNVYHIGPGQTYTTIRAGIAAAMASSNSVVYIHPGTYNLVTEFADSISASMGIVGNPIGNGITVICYDGVKINANFDFSSGYSDSEKRAIYTNFNPFYSVDGDFKLINMNIEATNTRYCVHDERNGTGTHIHEYINCKMKYNVDYHDGGQIYVQCIGGGLGRHSTIVVEGGYYESNTSIGLPTVENGDVNYAQQPITYHNGVNIDCESSITIKNVYFADKGYFRIGDYGASTKLSKVYVSGCRFGFPVLHKYENGTVDHDNFEVAADWNNEVANDGHWTVAPDGLNAAWTPA